MFCCHYCSNHSNVKNEKVQLDFESVSIASKVQKTYALIACLIGFIFWMKTNGALFLYQLINYSVGRRTLLQSYDNNGFLINEQAK